MLDSKILDFARRLIQTDIKKRQQPFFDELSRKGRKLQLSGNSPETSSSGKKIIRNIFTKELETRASIVWKSLQLAHKAVGSKPTKTLASDFKEAVNHFLKEISKELSGLMIKKPCFAKDDKANSNLYSAMNDVYEEINIGIDLYVSNLQSHITQKMNSGEKEYDSIVELLRKDYLLKTDDDVKQKIATAAQNMVDRGLSNSTVSINAQLKPRLEQIKNLFDYLIDSLQSKFAYIPLGKFRNKLLVIAQEEYKKLSSVPTALLVKAGLTSQDIIKQYEQKLKQEMSKTKTRIETQCGISDSKIHWEKRNKSNAIRAHKPCYKKAYILIIALIIFLTTLTTLILNFNNIIEMIWGEAGKQTPIKVQAVPTDATGLLRTDKAPLFEDKVDVYLGLNLYRRAVERVGNRQVVRALKGLDIALEEGQIKVTAKILSSDGKVAVELWDNEWEITRNPVPFKRNYDKHGLEVRDNNGLIVLQVDLLDKHTLKVAGLFELEGMAVCITDMRNFSVPWSKINEHFAQIVVSLKSQGLMFRYPANKHFGERTDRPQIKLPGRDERLSTKNIAAKRKNLSALSNVELKKRVRELVAAIQQSISQALKVAPPEPNNLFEELKELDEHILTIINTTDPEAAQKLVKKIEELPLMQRIRAGIQEYDDQFKPDIVALYDEIAFRLGTRAKEMPGRVLFENPPSALFLREFLNELVSVAETLE